MKRFLLFTGIILQLIFCAFTAVGQDVRHGIKIWYDFSIEANFRENYAFRFKQIISMNTRSYRLGFVQNDFGFEYQIIDRMFVGTGYVWSLFKDSESLRELYHLDPNVIGMLDFNRIYLDYSFKHNFFSKNVQLKHKAGFQYFWPQLRKYRYRVTYSAKFEFPTEVIPWQGVPYIENKIYIYLDGIPANYYDIGTGEVIATSPPNGLHRYRVKTGIQFRPTGAQFYFAPYFFYQREFNTGLLPGHDLHITDPTTGEYTYRFNNYFTIGINLTYKFIASSGSS